MGVSEGNEVFVEAVRAPLSAHGTATPTWPAAGFEDTLLRCKTKPEVVHGNETAVQPGVQA